MCCQLVPSRIISLSAVPYTYTKYIYVCVMRYTKYLLAIAIAYSAYTLLDVSGSGFIVFVFVFVFYSFISK